MSLYPLVAEEIPEIPDSSKWSSNLMTLGERLKTLRPEIPDSSKWSSNEHFFDCEILLPYP